MNVELKRLYRGEGLPMPSYQTAGSSGMDIASSEDITLKIGDTVLVPTGFAFGIPEGFELQVRSRSGLAYKHGIFVTNGIGTIDEDYTGELKVLLTYLGKGQSCTQPFEIRRGDRIAQIVLAPVSKAELQEVSTLKATERGVGGFGSTGSSSKKEGTHASSS